VARPGTTVSTLTTMVSASSTIWVEPRPSSSGPSSQIDHCSSLVGVPLPLAGRGTFASAWI
jgi:hypothetical protein